MISDFRDLEDGFPPKAVAIWIKESLSFDSKSALSASFVLIASIPITEVSVHVSSLLFWFVIAGEFH